MGSVFGSIFDRFGARVGHRIIHLILPGLTVEDLAATNYHRGYRLFLRLYVAKHMVRVNSFLVSKYLT